MSEKFDSQEYRDNLAKSLETKRDFGEEGRELAKEQLDLEKDTIEYKRAKIQHKEDNLTARGRIPTSDVENIETSKVEWGPDLGKMSSNDFQEKLIELNKNLESGEKPWRLPTDTELYYKFFNTRNEDEFNFGYYFINDMNFEESSKDFRVFNPNTDNFMDGSKEESYNVIFVR